MRTTTVRQAGDSLARAALAAFVVALIAIASPAHAQSRARVTVDFPFIAAGIAMDAGAYDVEATSEQLTLRAVSGRSRAVMMPVITRLGMHEAVSDTKLVFAKVAGTLYLSEVWFPNLDGFVVFAAPADHEHSVIGGSPSQR
jgi:hypothetical protein